MSKNRTTPDRKTRIVAVSAMVVAVVGGLSLFTTANGATNGAANGEAASPTVVTEPANVIATSCGGFAADARKLFDKRGSVVLSGTFAPGDHVHLAIDLEDSGYAWELSGALGTEAIVSPSFWYRFFRTTKMTNHVVTTWSPQQKLLSTDFQGKVNGYARWDVELDVTSAGEGALTIKQISTVPPRVAIASCTPRKAAPITAG